MEKMNLIEDFRANHFLDHKLPGIDSRLTKVDYRERSCLKTMGIERITFRQNREDLRIGRTEPLVGSILITLAGTGRVYENGQWKTSRPGSIYFIPKDEFHAYLTKKHWGWDFSVVRIMDEDLSDLLIPFSHAHLVEHKNTNGLYHAIRGFFLESLAEVKDETLVQWISLIITCIKNTLPVSSNIDAKLNYVWDKVSLDLAKRWTLDEIATLSGLNRDKLRKLCIEKYGHSPMQHVTRMRMIKAGQDIELGLHDVRRVASRVGYSNEKAFRKAFTRIMGSSPLSMAKNGSESEALQWD